VVAFGQGSRRLLTAGANDDAVGLDLPVAVRVGHGITVDHDSDAIWIADPGLHARVVDGAVVRETNPGRVVRISRRGSLTAEMESPPLPVYRDQPYRPTSVALVADQLWIADGYGQSLVHRFATDGSYLGSIDGTERGRPHFDCPHALFLDPRVSEPRVWVADRGNATLRAYDTDGALVRTAGAGVLNSPSGMAVLGDLMVVAELGGWLTVLDADDGLVGTVGKSPRSRQEPGWPNAQRDGVTLRPPLRPRGSTVLTPLSPAPMARWWSPSGCSAAGWWSLCPVVPVRPLSVSPKTAPPSWA
jgi:hypothetical protein